MAIPVACDIAAPSPWNMRKNIISNIGDDICSELDKDGEEPAKKAIIPNSNIPVMYIGFRPTMSDNLPMGSSIALMVSDSASTTHWIVVRGRLKYWAMVGRAILTPPW